MRRHLWLAVLALGAMAIVALTLIGLGGHPVEAMIGGGAFLPFMFGTTHSTLSDQTDTSNGIAAISVVGAVNGAIIDMQGWEGLLVTISVGVISATGTLDGKLQSGSLANGSDMADVPSSNITQLLPANSGSVVQISAYRLTNRYARVVLTQATAAALASVTYTRYRRTGINPGAQAGQPAQSPIQIVKVVQN